jgi:hypothetical protein
MFCFFQSGWSQGISPVGIGELQFNTGLQVEDPNTIVFFGLDIGVEKNVTVGTNIKFSSGLMESRYGVETRVDYHFNEILNLKRNWDIFAGFRADLWFATKISTFDINYKLDIGGRWYWNDHWGIQAAVGTNPFRLNNISLYHSEKIGITYRL